MILSDDYLTARAKCQIAEDTSELDTSAGEANIKKRRIRKAKRLSSSEEECATTELLKPPPKIRKTQSTPKAVEGKFISDLHNLKCLVFFFLIYFLY